MNSSCGPLLHGVSAQWNMLEHPFPTDTLLTLQTFFVSQAFNSSMPRGGSLSSKYAEWRARRVLAGATAEKLPRPRTAL